MRRKASGCPIETRQGPCGQAADTDIGLPLVPAPWTEKRVLWIGPWCNGHAEFVAGHGIRLRHHEAPTRTAPDLRDDPKRAGLATRLMDAAEDVILGEVSTPAIERLRDAYNAVVAEAQRKTVARDDTSYPLPPGNG